MNCRFSIYAARLSIIIYTANSLRPEMKMLDEAKYRVVWGYMDSPARSVAVVVPDDGLNSISRAKVIAGAGFEHVSSKVLTFIEADVIESNSNLLEQLVSADELKKKFAANSRAVRGGKATSLNKKQARRRGE